MLLFFKAFRVTLVMERWQIKEIRAIKVPSLLFICVFCHFFQRLVNGHGTVA